MNLSICKSIPIIADGWVNNWEKCISDCSIMKAKWFPKLVKLCCIVGVVKWKLVPMKVIELLIQEVTTGALQELQGYPGVTQQSYKAGRVDMQQRSYEKHLSPSFVTIKSVPSHILEPTDRRRIRITTYDKGSEYLFVADWEQMISFPFTLSTSCLCEALLQQCSVPYSALGNIEATTEFGGSL